MIGLALAGLATAAEPDVHLDLLVGTTLPTDLGGRLQLEVPGRVRLGVHGGWLPPAYVDLVNAIAVSAGWYDEQDAQLVRSSLESAFVGGADVGWRPLRRHGFFFGAGWQVAALGGGLTGEEALSVVLGQPLPTLPGSSRQVDASAVVHLVTAEVGWEQVWLDRIVLGVGLGGAFTVAADSELKSERDLVPGSPSDRFYRSGEAYLEDTFRAYLHTPTIRVQLGVRFL